MRSRCLLIGAALGVAGAGTTLNADMSGYVYAVGYPVSADGDGVFGGATFDGYVVDLYAVFDEAEDILLNAFNFYDINYGTTYYQSFTGGGWLPNNLGPPFETDNLQYADSYVSIGGYNGGVQPGADGTGLDPNFGGNHADGPGRSGGWYNSNPGDPIGAIRSHDAIDGIYSVFIGRFSLNNGGEAFSLARGYGEVTWNQGLGTPGHQKQFVVIDFIESDCNDNGIFDVYELADGSVEDVDGDGIPDECIMDCNKNGINDSEDIATGTSEDCNLNSVPDECEFPTSVFTTSDATIPTAKSPLEISCPTDALAVTDTLIDVTATGDFENLAEFFIVSLNGETVGYLFASDGGDCTQTTGTIAINAAQWNGAGKIDAPVVGIVASAAVDPDECASSAIEVVVTVETEYPDCNENGTWDECDIASGNSADCNTNGRPDECDIGDEIKEDCNDNGVIDFCELDETNDCNNNGRLDACDLAEGTSFDCNGNLVPDECDIADGKLDDNDNGIPDSCDLARGDLNLDGCVGGGDLGVLLSLWGFPEPPIGDLDGDGVIGGGDLGILLLNWERCP